MLAGIHPPQIALEDATGRGVLDVDDEPTVTWGGPTTAPDWLPHRFGDQIVRSPDHRSFDVVWGTVDAGEPLLVYGDVERVMPSAVSAPTEARQDGYRVAADVPLVRAKEGRTAVAHVGTEAALLSMMGRERVAVTFVLSLLSLSTVAAILAIVTIAQR